MTFIEMLLLVQERGEQVVEDKAASCRTNKHMYIRTPDGDWQERDIPPPIVSEFQPLKTKEDKK